MFVFILTRMVEAIRSVESSLNEGDASSAWEIWSVAEVVRCLPMVPFGKVGKCLKLG